MPSCAFYCSTDNNNNNTHYTSQASKYHHPPPNRPTTTHQDELPLHPLPCQLCTTAACATPSEPGHDAPVMIVLSHTSREHTGCGIFCGEGSPFNTFYIIYDRATKLSRDETILHSAVMAVKNVAAFLAGNPHESVTGPAAIRRILLKVDWPDFVSWYEQSEEDRGPVSPRCAGLLRALEDAAARFGECGEYRPDVKFVVPEGTCCAVCGAEVD